MDVSAGGADRVRPIGSSGIEQARIPAGAGHAPGGGDLQLRAPRNSYASFWARRGLSGIQRYRAARGTSLDDLAAALWLATPAMYVPAVVAEESGVDLGSVRPAPEYGLRVAAAVPRDAPDSGGGAQRDVLVSGASVGAVHDDTAVPEVQEAATTGSSTVAASADWRSLIEQWDDWDADVMLRIIACESGGSSTAVSPGGANVGAYQLNQVHGYSYEQMTDPATSTALAHDIWLSQGYGAWSCYG